MKYYIVFIFLLFTGCVIQPRENYPLTKTESNFYQRRIEKSMSLDSLNRKILKYVPWSKYPKQYTYNLTMYLSDTDNGIDSLAFRVQADSMAHFSVKFMTNEKMKVHDLFLHYFLNDHSIWFIYQVNDKNQPILQEYSY